MFNLSLFEDDKFREKCFKLFVLIKFNKIKWKAFKGYDLIYLIGWYRWFKIIKELAIEFDCLDFIYYDDQKLDRNDDNYQLKYNFIRLWLGRIVDRDVQSVCNFNGYRSIKTLLELVYKFFFGQNLRLEPDVNDYQNQNQINFRPDHLDRFERLWLIYDANEKLDDDEKHFNDFLDLFDFKSDNTFEINLDILEDYFFTYHDQLIINDDFNLTIFNTNPISVNQETSQYFTEENGKIFARL